MRAFGEVSVGNVLGVRQVPGLREAVAGGAHVSAMDVRDHRDRSLVGLRIRVAPVARAGRIRPVKGLVHRQQVGEVVALLVHQFIDPPHEHLLVGLGLNGEGR